jgi:hypothetical protein
MKKDKYAKGWLPTGEPTRRHLGLMMWAYTPTPGKTKKWLSKGSRAMAPGYRSWQWTQQKWKSVKINSKGQMTLKACGAEGTKYKNGKPALCLPVYVITELQKTPKGRKILKDQALAKKRAKKGARVKWHPRIKELHRQVEKMTPKDRR